MDKRCKDCKYKVYEENDVNEVCCQMIQSAYYELCDCYCNHYTVPIEVKNGSYE